MCPRSGRSFRPRPSWFFGRPYWEVAVDVIRPFTAGEISDVVAPALNSRLKHWLSDEDGARREAAQRVDDCVARLRQAGLTADGTIGDPDPLHAIEDALGDFPADRIVISTHPEGRSNWLAHDLVGRAEQQFHVPITHVVVDLERAGQEHSGGPTASAAR